MAPGDPIRSGLAPAPAVAPIASDRAAIVLGERVVGAGELDDLARDRAAIVVGERVVSAGELDELVTARAGELGRRRQLLLLAGGNDLDTVVTYLAARAARHPLILIGHDADDRAIVDRYRPDAIVTAGPHGCDIDRRPHAGHELHPELALLLSTSGSTGAPKLVRLSRANVDANARQIATFQQLRPDDRGITSLPLHYCYGLSVLNAHLAAGASVVLTDLSVVDRCFWEAMRAHSVTNLAGVPHTFELIERAGIDRLRLASLRFVTQAGGRMDPAAVRRLAELGRESGWDLIVMYGQTEATARMGYLPSDLVLDHPDRVGIAVPGGRFDIEPCDEAGEHAAATGVGEIVYRGPNVMMGYAEQPTDLARGPELDRLATGDLGRIDAHGLLEIVGRRSRFAKLFGLRVDLGRVERQLAERGIAALCASDDTRLVVGVEVAGGSRPPASLAELVAGLTALPARSITVVACERLPRLANAKPDPGALMALAARAALPARTRPATSIAAIYAELLGVPSVAGSDTFASLGGDSFSYVEASIRIEASLGVLPDAWHMTPVAELDQLAGGRHRRLARIETNVVLRAVAIVSIVTTHMHVARVPAGAHILLAVVGFNYARFQLPRLRASAGWERLREGLAAPVRLAMVTSAWVAIQIAVFGHGSLTTLLLVHDYLGAPEHVDGRWRYWFFEVVVQLAIVMLAVLSIPAVRRFEQRHRFLLPVALLVPAAVLRFELVRLVDRDYNYVYRPDTIVWCFLLGWAAAQAATRRQQLAVTAIALALVPGFFDYPDRELRLTLAIVALAWVPTVPLPRPLARPVGWLASASMWIFMTHWIVWPELARVLPLQVALVGTLAAGVLGWAGWRSIGRWIRSDRRNGSVWWNTLRCVRIAPRPANAA